MKIKDAEGSSLFDESAGSVVGYTAPSSVRVFEKPASGPLVQKGCGLVEVYDND